MNGFAIQADVDGAFRILSLMKQRGILPNKYTLTSLMTACLSAKKIVKAKLLLNDEKLFQLLEYHLTNRDKVALHGSYSIGLCQLHNQLWDRREAIDPLSSFDTNTIKLRNYYFYEAQLSLIEMERQGLIPDVTTLNAFIQSLCVQHPSRVIDALLLLPAMEAMGILPDKYTYSILFTALGKYGYLEESLALFRAITINDDDNSNDQPKNHGTGFAVLDTSCFNSLLRSFVSGPSPLDCIHLFHQLANKNDSIGLIEDFVPDKITFTILFLSIVKHLSMDNAADDPRSVGIFDESSTTIDQYDNVYEQSNSFTRSISSSSHTSVNSGGNSIILNITSPLLKVYRRLAIVDLQLPTDDPLENYFDSDDDDTYRKPYQLNDYLINKESATSPQQQQQQRKPTPLNIDKALMKLYKLMRDHYSISPDVMMVKTISSLFSPNKHHHNSGNIFGKMDITNNNYNRISSDTARYIFEDLVILGVHPSEVNIEIQLILAIMIIFDIHFYYLLDISL